MFTATSPLHFYAGLMGLFEKRRFRNFLQYAHEFEPDDNNTWKGFNASMENMQACFTKFGLDGNTAEVTGHALALHLNDE